MTPQFIHRAAIPLLIVLLLGSTPALLGQVKPKAPADRSEKPGMAVGNVAPDIEGQDVDGRKFKLSDYRGKVVLIDFWGDW